MNAIKIYLPALLWSAAVAQLLIAALNFGLVRMMGWRAQLARLDVLPRQVFHVHVWFISVTLTLFGVLSLKFASEMASGEVVLAKWLAVGIGVFWGLRGLLQISYYDSGHWRGSAGKTVGHVGAIGLFFGLALVYLLVGLQ